MHLSFVALIYPFFFPDISESKVNDGSGFEEKITFTRLPKKRVSEGIWFHVKGTYFIVGELTRTVFSSRH